MQQTVLQAIQLAFVAMPWVLAFGIPLAAMVALLIGRRTAIYWVGAYFTMLLYFPSGTYGQIDAAADSDFYNRATGTFYFSAINVMLFGLALQAFFARRFRLPQPVVRHNLLVPALVFLAVFAGNVVVAQSLPLVRWTEVIGPAGLLNVFNFILAFYVLTSALREPKDVDRLTTLILVCGVTRGLWGLFRFAALGGDPSNFYANVQHLDVRLTFFDINDSLIAMLVLFLAGWRLLSGQCKTVIGRFLHQSVVVLELFIIVFSYRRTAWGGLVLALLLFAFYRPARQRWLLLIGSMSVGLPLLAYKLAQRTGSARSGGSWLETALPDVVRNGQFNFTSGRFSELYAAWLSFSESPIWGLGTWGRYDGSRFSELAWHRGDFGWMHSGMLHIMLKSGLIGAAAVVLVAVLFVAFIRRHLPLMDESNRCLFLAGAAGMLFMLPNWLVGTPVIEFRTMQLMALCLALPYLVAATAPARTAMALERQASPPWVFGIRPLKLRPTVLQPYQRG